MPKNIVICFDGTWNTPDKRNLAEELQVESNVVRLLESIATSRSDGRTQFKWYDSGIGTKWYDRVLGGAFGLGLDLNIVQGFKALAENYEDGDDVYIFGFSRGAYTARSLVGLIRNVGLLNHPNLASLWLAYGVYRTRSDKVDSLMAKLLRRDSRAIKIKFLGVWDTVGALGIPLKAFKDVNLRMHQFHDTELSGIVEHAYQALAVDEHREIFEACVWKPMNKPGQTLEQRWFIGSHADVGGGYEDRRLSDISLKWMQEKVQQAGLTLKPERVITDTAQNFKAPIRDSYAEFLRGVYAKDHARFYRPVGSARDVSEIIDESVHTKIKKDAKYKPKNVGL